jgi:leader peptidase (prepilin peptidase) / N-methyltransferase
MIFLFMLGASVGSFLNVVIYRLPLEMSLISPGSHCPSCKHPIAWYDNLPIIAWFLLRGRCRHCQGSYSIRYSLIELLTAILFVSLYWAYFQGGVRQAMPPFEQGGWVIYAGHIVLICVLLASTMIDAEHWIIPLSVCYTGAIVGFLLSAIGPYWVETEPGIVCQLLPWATAKMGSVALGAVFGLIIGFLLIKSGLLKRSFEDAESVDQPENRQEASPGDSGQSPTPTVQEYLQAQAHQFSARREMVREIAFLAPAVVLGLVFMWFLAGDSESGLTRWWHQIIISQKWLAGLLGSVFGFMIGAAVVWGTRILGSLAFGREAMGLGDVHLMAAVGAVLGWSSPTIAFFIAPFFGLGWALARLLIHRSREIPYGPFLSAATVVVMIFHDPILAYFTRAFTPGIIVP